MFSFRREGNVIPLRLPTRPDKDSKWLSLALAGTMVY